VVWEKIAQSKILIQKSTKDYFDKILKAARNGRFFMEPFEDHMRLYYDYC
jgi:hypothetical protein